MCHVFFVNECAYNFSDKSLFVSTRLQLILLTSYKSDIFTTRSEQYLVNLSAKHLFLLFLLFAVKIINKMGKVQLFFVVLALLCVSAYCSETAGEFLKGTSKDYISPVSQFQSHVKVVLKSCYNKN